MRGMRSDRQSALAGGNAPGLGSAAIADHGCLGIKCHGRTNMARDAVKAVAHGELPSAI